MVGNFRKMRKRRGFGESGSVEKCYESWNIVKLELQRRSCYGDHKRDTCVPVEVQFAMHNGGHHLGKN